MRKHQIQTTNEMPKLQAEYPIFETQLKIHGTKQNEIYIHLFEHVLTICHFGAFIYMEHQGFYFALII